VGMTTAAISNFSAVQALGEQAQATLLALFGHALARLPAALLAVIVIFITSSVARVATRSSTAVGARILRSPSLRILFSKAAAIGVWLIGTLVASLLLFPGLRLGDVVATLGLGSVAIGFAFQDIFKNFLAGVLLLVNEPFRIGDAVVIENYEGVVTHIDIRTTNVRTYTGDLVLIPNSIVFTSSVQVRTAYPQRRTDLVVGVAYATNLGAAIELARTTIAGVEGVVAEPAVVVDASAFGDSAINLTMRYWTLSEKQQVLRTQTRVLIAVKAAFDQAGIEIPFPIRTLVVPDPHQPIFASDDPSRP
jgi:small conductance mechanosensitive channel